MFSTFQMISGNFFSIDIWTICLQHTSSVQCYVLFRMQTYHIWVKRNFHARITPCNLRSHAKVFLKLGSPAFDWQKFAFSYHWYWKLLKDTKQFLLKWFCCVVLSDTWYAWIWAHFFLFFFFMKILNYWKSEVLFSVCQLPKVGETCSQSEEEAVYSGQQTTARLTDQSQGRKWAPSWENMSSVCDQLRLKPAWSADETS